MSSRSRDVFNPLVHHTCILYQNILIHLAKSISNQEQLMLFHAENVYEILMGSTSIEAPNIHARKENHSPWAALQY